MDNLLIVDDNPQNIYMLQTLLSASGFQVQTASNGEEALELARRLPPAMIISDILMPVMDGFSLCRAWKQDEHLKNIPFIFYTATYTDPKDEEFALSLGAELFIIKPIEPEKLLKLTREMIETHKTGSVVSPRKPITGETEFYERYSARLIRKLENKLLQLEEANRALKISIIERKQAEEKLSASESKLRALFAAMKDVVTIIDKDGIYRMIAPTDPSLLSRPADELLGKSLRDVFPLEEAEKFLASTRHVLETKQTEHIEYELPIGGRHLWFATSITPMTDDATVWVARDITEPKQAEEARRAVEAKFRALVEQIPAITYIDKADKSAVSLFVSPQIESVLGVSQEEWQKGDINFWASMIPTDDREHVMTAYQHTIDTGEPFDEEYRMTRRDGRLIWIDDHAILLRDTTGQPDSLHGVMFDITERKQAEEAIKRHLFELEVVSRLSTSLRSAQTLNEMLPCLMEEILSLFGTDAGVIWLYNTTSSKLHQVIAHGWFSRIKEPELSVGEGIAGHVFETGEAHISIEFVNDALTRQKTLPQIPAGWGGVCVPIRAERETIGVLFVAVQLPRQLGEQDVHLLATITDIAGSAIRRAGLHEQTQKQVQRLAALRSIDMAIGSVLDMRLTLDILLNHILGQLGVDAADILLLNTHTQTLDFSIGRGFRTRGIENLHVRLGESHAGRAALEHRTINIPNISAADQDLLKGEFLANEGFIAYFAVPLFAKGQIKGVLEIYHRSELNPDPEWLNFLETLGGQAALAIDNATLFENLQRSNVDLALAYDATIEGWSRALDLREHETERHSDRVTNMTINLARTLGLGEAELVHVRRGALLHDIGKMGVPDNILLKPGKLTEEEWMSMRLHPQLAHDMLAPIAYLSRAVDIPYCHHEKWDGTGYPRGLKGEQIPLAARIFAVVDVYDALTSDRPYRKAWPKQQALDYIREQDGKHFDPKVVKVFLDLIG